MADLSAKELGKAIKDILKGADLDNLSTKKVRKQLEQKFDADLSKRKKEIDKLVMQMITENEEEGDKDEDDDDEPSTETKTEANSDDETEKNDDQNGAASEHESEEEEEVEVPKKKAKTSASKEKSSSKEKSAPKKRKSAGKADDSEDPVMSSIKEMDDEDLAKKLQEEESGLRRRGARRAAAPPPKPRKKREKDPDKKSKTSHYSKPCHLSEDLAAVVGATEMPRAEVVKTLWSIVKERNLQDPSNRQFMKCDEQLQALFGLKRVRCFGMMKYLKKHIKDVHDTV